MSETSNRSIDIGKQQIGGVYAKALLGAAKEDGNAAEVVTEFGEFITSVVDRLPAFRSLLESPRVSIEDKLVVLDRALQGRISTTLLRFLKVVCEHERMDCLAEIYRETRSQYNASQQIVQVQVTTAHTIDSDAYGKLLAGLKNRFGDKIDVETFIDASLIGGVVVRVGDKVFDGSVAQKLKSLREEAVAKAVAQMRGDLDRFAASA